MTERPRLVYILILLWLALSCIFVLWGSYSLLILVQIPSWENFLDSSILPPLHFGYLMGTIVWFMFSILFVVFAYGTFKTKSWVWTAGLIITTIFLVVFGLMLTSLMITAMQFRDLFSVAGLTTTVLALLADIGIVFCITRPVIKLYFGSNATE